MAVADHGVDAGQRGDLLRRPLRVAAGDQDARSGIFPAHAAQEGAGGAVGLCGDTAGIGDDHVGPGGAQSRAQAAMAQLRADDLAVGPAGTASEVLNVVFCHVVSLINRTDAAQTNAISGRIRSGDEFSPETYSYCTLEFFP